MRGVFSSGVLDEFMEQDFQPFDLAIACSAGACNVASYLAGHRGRSRICYTKYMARSDFISARRFLRGGHWVDLDWLWRSFESDHPLDRAKLEASQVEFLLAATSYDTGSPVYLKPARGEFMDALKGSCALPLLYRSAVYVSGQRLVDGGVSAPIPVEEAYRRGARRILVIRSRPPAFSKKPSADTAIAMLVFRRAPGLAFAMRRAPDRYRAAVSFISNPPTDCTILHVAPPSKLATGRTTKSTRALERDYALGRRLGALAVRDWLERLSADGSMGTKTAQVIGDHGLDLLG
jgi:predicted patatin/cPLA2 family phospholipase